MLPFLHVHPLNPPFRFHPIQEKKYVLWIEQGLSNIGERVIWECRSSSMDVRFHSSFLVTFFHFDSFVFGSILLYEKLSFKYQTEILE